MEALGREGREKLGYARILELARMAGFVKRKKVTEGPRAEGALVGITTQEALTAADVFIEVFSEYAVTAGVVSQADSPLPGPADLVALGILMFGIANATVMTAEDLEKVRPKSCSSEFPKLRVCLSLPAEYTFPSVGAALAKMKAVLGKKNLQLQNPDDTRSGPCEGTGEHFNVRQGKERAGSITCCPCCTEGPAAPKEIKRCRIVD
jgi:hypothetical protein